MTATERDTAVAPVPATSRAALLFALVAGALLVAAVVAARVSTPAFAAFGVALVAVLGYGMHRWPRAMLLVVALTPMVDLYLVGILLPAELEIWSRLVSEVLLALAAVIVGIDAIRSRTVVPALRHPVVGVAIVFVLIAAVSALVNRVPPHIAVLGIIVTVDAVALFVLARMVPFGERLAAVGIGVFVVGMFAAAVIAILQTMLGPQVIGLPFRIGHLGESVRAGSFFVDPGVFGAAVGVAAAFPLFAAFRLPRPEARWGAAAVALVLMIAVVLTFSRGSWVGLALGVGVVALLLDARAFVLTVVLTVLALGAVAVMPRNVLLAAAPDDTGTPAATAAESDATDVASASPTPTATPRPTPPEAPDIIGSTVAKMIRVATGGDARARFIINAVPIVREHPVVGVGPGRYGGAVAAIFGTPIHAQYETDQIINRVGARTVDNFWLHVVVEFGIVGLAAYLAMFGILAVSLFRAARRAAGIRFVVLAGTLAMLAFLSIHAITGMLLEGNAISFALWLFLGICSLLGREASPEAPAEVS